MYIITLDNSYSNLLKKHLIKSDAHVRSTLKVSDGKMMYVHVYVCMYVCMYYG